MAHLFPLAVGSLAAWTDAEVGRRGKGKDMSTDSPIPERWREKYDEIAQYPHSSSIVPELIASLGAAESLVREQVKLLQEVLSLVDESDHDKRAPEYLRQQARGIVANKIRRALSRIPKELK